MAMRLLTACGVVALAAVVSAAGEQYRFVQEIPVGGPGGGDYLSIDPVAHRLYVSHSTHVVVIDTERNVVAGDIPGTDGVHGLALAPDLKRGFSSNGRANTVGIVDLTTLRTVKQVPTGETPDAILYEPGRREVYSFNGKGRSATVIDAAGGTVVATIPLDAKPESGAADPEARRVYVNLQDRNAIGVIDTATHAVVARWPVSPAGDCTGMAIDAPHQRLFVGCRSGQMLMLDIASGAVVASVPIGPGVDATWYDPTRKLAFSSCGGNGTVTVAQVEPGAMTVIETVRTHPLARTMALDTVTHRLYLSSADYTDQKDDRGRPAPKPDSFKVLVYAMEK